MGGSGVAGVSPTQTLRLPSFQKPRAVRAQAGIGGGCAAPTLSRSLTPLLHTSLACTPLAPVSALSRPALYDYNQFRILPPLLFDLISSPQHLNRDLSQNVAFSHPHGSKRFQDFGPKTESALLESMGHTNSTDSDGPNTDSLLLECYGATAAVDLECEIYTTGVLVWNPSAPFSHRRALTRTRRHQRAPPEISYSILELEISASGPELNSFRR